jgi:hypothetical protein
MPEKSLDVRLKYRGVLRKPRVRVKADPKNLDQMREILLTQMREQERAKEVDIEKFSMVVYEPDNERELFTLAGQKEAKR